MSETVKKMLKEDIGLKNILIREIRKAMALTGFCIIVVVIAGIVYFAKTRELFFKTWREEMELSDRKKDSVRFDKELMYRLQDTTQYYVRPMYDTIK